MSVARWLWLAVFLLGIFVMAGYLIAFQSAAVSESPLLTNLVLAVAAVSLFAWPVCLARAFQVYLKDKPRR